MVIYFDDVNGAPWLLPPLNFYLFIYFYIKKIKPDIIMWLYIYFFFLMCYMLRCHILIGGHK